MMISEMIENLKNIREEWGELSIMGHGHNSQCLFPLHDLEVKKYDDCDDHFVELDCDMRY